jgi:lysophospholipase L1-like esterase
VFHEFKGKRAKDITRYIEPHLMDDQPHSVMFVAGGNDLPSQATSLNRINEVAKCLIDAGVRCKSEFGVSEVFISSILPRDNRDFQINRQRLNDVLRGMCASNNFTFIENKGIVLDSHVAYDGVHLNKRGTDVLHTNIIDYINGT